MKKILIYILCSMMLLCSAQAEEIEFAPGEKLGFALLDALYTPGENTVISPLSLQLAMSMAAEGAQGETLREMMAALGMEELSGATSEDIHSANAVFTGQGIAIKPEYADRLNEGYAAQWFEMDADVVERVNAWVAENTDGLIEELISDAPDADTGMMIINAIAMDAQWANPFKSEHTAVDVFYAPQGEVQADMMWQQDFFDYAEKDGCQIVRLPYMDSSLEMWIVMPEDGGMEALLEALAEEGLGYLQEGIEETEVSLILPKLDITDDHTLVESLKALGINAAFGPDADFSGISDAGMFISEILQKARVQIDEEGTKAAAATAMIMTMSIMGPPSEPVEMRVDRPYALVISDAQTGSICFAGVIENPVA